MLGTLTFDVDRLANGWLWRAMLDGDIVKQGTESTQLGLVRKINRMKREAALGKGF